MNQLAGRTLLAAVMTMSLTACNGGTQKFFESLDLGVKAQGDQQFIELSSTFDLGNVSLAEMDLTVIDPHTKEAKGTASFSQTPDSKGKITLRVNADVILHGDADLGLSLPNGRPIPAILGAKRGDLLGIDILEHSRIYIGGDIKQFIYAGVAIGVKGLDQVMSQIQAPANIFFAATFGKVTGVGGVYSGTEAGSSGIAVFAKYNAAKALTPTALGAPLSVDPQDNELDQLDSGTQYRLYNFFHGKHRVIRAH